MKNRLEVAKSLLSPENVEFLYSVFEVWESIDIAGLKSYTFKLFSQDKNKLKYVCSVASHWYATTDNGWEFNEYMYKKYFSKEEIYKIIDELEKEDFSLFSDLEQIKLASFFANYNTHDMK